MVRPQDYNGPFQKTVAFFAGPMERKSVPVPHYKPGAVLCSLAVRDKFILFVRDAYDPGTFVSAAFNAGISQMENHDAPFGQGMAGYGKRIGASYTDEASFRFFKDFGYPSLFGEDPRYYPMAQGIGGRRFLHALEHAFVAHRDNGHRMFNFSEWLGTASALSLSNEYHPGNRRGFAPTAEAQGWTVAGDMGFDVLREFWPEIIRRFRLPLRAEPNGASTGSNPAIK